MPAAGLSVKPRLSGHGPPSERGRCRCRLRGGGIVLLEKREGQTGGERRTRLPPRRRGGRGPPAWGRYPRSSSSIPDGNLDLGQVGHIKDGALNTDSSSFGIAEGDRVGMVMRRGQNPVTAVNGIWRSLRYAFIFSRIPGQESVTGWSRTG